MMLGTSPHSPPSLAPQAGATSGGLVGSILRTWLPGWNIQPGLYSLMAATATLGGVFRWALARRGAWYGPASQLGPAASSLCTLHLWPLSKTSYTISNKNEMDRSPISYPVPSARMLSPQTALLRTQRFCRRLNTGGLLLARSGCRNSISLVVLVMEGTRNIEYMGGIILSVSMGINIRIKPTSNPRHNITQRWAAIGPSRL